MAQLFSQLHQVILWQIADLLPLDILQNIVVVVSVNKHLKDSFMLVVHKRMDDILKKNKLLLCLNDATIDRPLNNLSDINLRLSKMILYVNDSREVSQMIQYMENISTTAEKYAIEFVSTHYKCHDKHKYSIRYLSDVINNECQYRFIEHVKI